MRFTAILLLAVSCFAQTGDTAEVSGRVTDETGAVLAKARLVLCNEATGHERATSSSDTGDFLFPFLTAGAYSLTAESHGFSRLRMEGVQVELNQRLALPLVLKVGGVEAQITVAAEPTGVESTNPVMKLLIGEKQVRDLPIFTGLTGRGILAMVSMLVPGASAFTPAGTGRDNGSVVSINGSPVQGIGFFTDGVDNTFHNSSGGGATTLGPNPDAMGEFSVLTHTFKAETGTHPVAIHLRTKGGGNQFHGQARAIVLHPALTTRDFFDREKKSLFSTYAPGFQFSGPIVLPRLYRGRDRTFFLVDLEGFRSRQGYTDRQPVLTNALRSGDFREAPERLRPRDPLTGQPFPGGVIPSSRILPQSRFYIDQFIPPPTEERELVASRTMNPSGAQLSTRVDHQFSPSRILNATAFYHSTRFEQPHWSTQGVVTRSEVPDWSYNLAVQYSHSLSPRAVNSFTFGRTDNSILNDLTARIDAPDLTQHGYNIRRENLSHRGFPLVRLSNTNSFDPGGYELYVFQNTLWSLRDDFSWNRGAHAFKAGVEVRLNRGLNFANYSTPPSFAFADFNPFGSGHEVGDFLLGIPLSYSQGTETEDHPRRALNAFYFQDDIKLRSNLTLNLGLRYELNGVWQDRDGRNAALRPGVQSAVFPAAPAGVIFTGDSDPVTGGRLGPGLHPTDHNNFAPRFGLAWSPGAAGGPAARLFGGPGRTSIRAGYGIYYVLGRSLLFANEAPPWFFSVDRDASQIRTSGGSFANPWGSQPNPFPAPLSRRSFAVPLQGIRLVEPDFRNPYQHQWTFSIQRQLPRQVTVELAYVGNTALHLTRQYQANPGLVTPQATVVNVQSRRPYRDFGAVTGYAADGTSSYHGFQAMVSRRFASNLQLSAHYVWSKALDNNGGDGRNITSAADRDATPRARANFDRRQHFVLYGVWDLPAVRRAGPMDQILTGWQTAWVVQMHSGMPLNIRNAMDSTLRGVANGYPDIVGPFRKLDPREVRSFQLPNGRMFSGNFLFDPSVFQTVSPRNAQEARSGTLGRNVFSGPGLNNVDLSLLRRIRLSERHRIEIRADVANLFNHAQFAIPGSQALFTSNFQFGRTFSTTGPRRIQWVVRYQF